jgi:hypothetical protein
MMSAHAVAAARKQMVCHTAALIGRDGAETELKWLQGYRNATPVRERPAAIARAS